MKLLITDIKNNNSDSFQNKIFKIENFLLTNLLNTLDTIHSNNNNIFKNIYKEICKIIFNYREYFFLNDKKSNTGNSGKTKSGFLDLITEFKNNNIKNINSAKIEIDKYINNLYIIDKKYKFKNLKIILNMYYNLVNKCIEKNIFSIADNNLPLSIKKNKITETITETIKEEINLIINKIKNYKEIPIQFIKSINNKLKLLLLLDYNNNNNFNNNIMFINCYFFIIKIILSKIKKNITYKDLFFSGGNIDDEKSKKDENSIKDILNILIIIIYYYTNINTNNLKLKDYEINYNNKSYTLPKDFNVLNIDIYNIIQEYLINNNNNNNNLLNYFNDIYNNVKKITEEK